MEATDVIQKIKYYGKVGNMWVTECWATIGKVHFSEKRSDAQEIDEYEIKWLRENIPDAKFIKLTVTIEENEQPFDELIF